jgi:hypothetical protein
MVIVDDPGGLSRLKIKRASLAMAVKTPRAALQRTGFR